MWNKVTRKSPNKGRPRTRHSMSGGRPLFRDKHRLLFTADTNTCSAGIELHLRAVIALVVYLRPTHRVSSQSRVLCAVPTLDQKPRIFRCFCRFRQGCNTQQCLRGRLQPARRKPSVCGQPAHGCLQRIGCRRAHITSDLRTERLKNASKQLNVRPASDPRHSVPRSAAYFIEPSFSDQTAGSKPTRLTFSPIRNGRFTRFPLVASSSNAADSLNAGNLSPSFCSR